MAKLNKSLSMEAYRSLRTSIQYSGIDTELQSLVVTSSIPSEGKSTVAANWRDRQKRACQFPSSASGTL